ncbi:MAG: LysR family transcriptional regulator [Holophaga sp.]|nr:LysR family transcriptional regulator [Holophaga sp.]
MNVTHRHIEVFRAVMTARGVTAAARLLCTSQPTVSRELAELERQLGFQLFDRVRGRLQPNARALILLDEVQRSYLGLDHVLTMAARLSAGGQGQLSIVCMPAFSHAPLPAVCRRFLAGHPEVSIAITPQESPLLEELLAEQRHDLGLTEHNNPPPGTRLEPLMEADEMCVLPLGHPLLAKPVLQPADFAGQRFVSLAAADPYRIQLDEVFRNHGVARVMAMETHSAVSVCAMVREGLGLAVVNPLTALAFLGHGLELRRFSVPIPFRVSLVRPEYRPSTPLADQFTAALRAEAGEILARLAQV